MEGVASKNLLDLDAGIQEELRRRPFWNEIATDDGEM